MKLFYINQLIAVIISAKKSMKGGNPFRRRKKKKIRVNESTISGNDKIFYLFDNDGQISRTHTQIAI